jgi:hypothetical protein
VLAECGVDVRDNLGATLSRLGDARDVLAPAEGATRRYELPSDGDTGALPPYGGVRSIALGFSAQLDWPAFGVGDAGPVVMNVAQHVVHPPEHLPRWPSGVNRPYLVFIVRSLDPARIAESLKSFQRTTRRGLQSPGGRQSRVPRGRVVVLRRPPAHHLRSAAVRVGDERILPIGSLQGRRYANRGVARRQHARGDQPHGPPRPAAHTR